MILIVDSGGSKADWLASDGKGNREQLSSLGLNPYNLTDLELDTRVSEVVYSLKSKEKIKNIHFYGAGCSSNQRKARVHNIFAKHFPLSIIEIEHDILGAARATLGSQMGISVILGTGSNCCLYDGENIVENFGGHGYILGDEGSGAALGKMLLSDYLNQDCPKDVVEIIENSGYFKDRADIIDKVYFQKEASRYLASFAILINENSSLPYFKKLIIQNFESFFQKHVAKIKNYSEMNLGAVGSVAHHFNEDFLNIAEKFDFNNIYLTQKPIEDLENFHLNR